MNGPPTPSPGHRIHCPYCDKALFLHLTKTDNTVLSLTPTDEIMALPYARDVDIFDPPIDQPNSRWSQVGADFFGWIKYDRLFGILRISRDLKVYYCVARCPECGTRGQDQVAYDGKRGLIDVFANLTCETTRLSGIWPQIFSYEPPDQPRRFYPRDFLSRIFSNYVTATAFLLFLYVGSFMSDIVTAFHLAPFAFGAFFADHFSALLIRGMMVISLFLLIAVRKRLIKLFTDESAFFKLFKLHDNKIGLIYWMNWAVSRFTGYQKQNRLATVNAVVFFGGFLSSLILIVAWVFSHAGILPPSPHQTVYAMCAELAFWLIISFIFGVIVWNQFDIPHYILPSLDRIPMRSERIHSFTSNFDVIIWIGIYSGCGILLLCATFIAVAILPVLIPGFSEPQWIVAWAEVALVVFYSIIIIRFVQRHTVIKVLLIVLVVLIYLLLKLWAPSLGLTKVADAGQYVEMLLILCLAGYFFFKLYGITCNSIRKTYVGELVRKQEIEAENYLVVENYEEYNKRRETIKHITDSATTRIIPLERVKQIVAVSSFLILVATFFMDLLRF